MLALILVVVLVLLVIAIISSPWRQSPGSGAEHPNEPLAMARAAVAQLEAERDAKYREIRDAQLDQETGKFSEQDFLRIDHSLRAEAVEILRRLDRAQAALDKLVASSSEHRRTPAPQHASGTASAPSVAVGEAAADPVSE